MKEQIESYISQELSKFAQNYNGSTVDKQRSFSEYKDHLHSQWQPNPIECIKDKFYHNNPSPPWLPEELTKKIRELYGWDIQMPFKLLERVYMY